MNIEQAKENIGKRVLCYNPYLIDKDLWIVSTTEGENGYCCVSIRSSTGGNYDICPSEIHLIPDQNVRTLSVNIDTSKVEDMLNQVEIRKEIAFLLIQNGHIVDKEFKEAVDNVLDAIGGKI
jgi:hypothetical protein